MLEQNKAKLLVKLSTQKYMGMTEMQKWVKEQIGLSKKTTIRIVDELVEQGFFEKIEIKKHGHQKYRVVTIHEDTSHKMYMKNPTTNKVVLWETQTQLGQHITNIEKRINEKLEKKNNEIDFDDIIGVLWILNTHNKITWAINSGWFGKSKKESHLAEANRKNLDELMIKINIKLLQKDQELWHNILHTIYDIIDSQRILSKTQLRIVYPSSKNITTRKRNK